MESCGIGQLAVIPGTIELGSDAAKAGYVQNVED
jgi:hypothetical protein